MFENWIVYGLVNRKIDFSLTEAVLKYEVHTMILRNIYKKMYTFLSRHEIKLNWKGAIYSILFGNTCLSYSF